MAAAAGVLLLCVSSSVAAAFMMGGGSSSTGSTGSTADPLGPSGSTGSTADPSGPSGSTADPLGPSGSTGSTADPSGPSGPSGSTAASVSVNLRAETIDAFNAGKWTKRNNARLTTTPIFADTYPSEARTKMGEYIMPSFEKCRARDDCIALTVRGASVMGHATDTTLTIGSGVGFTLYKSAPKNENLVEIPTITSFVVSDEAPVEEGNYIIDQRRFGRKCTSDLKSCFSSRDGNIFKIQSVGDNKYAILNTGNDKYCDSSLVCSFDDVNDATREFSFKAATGDYHRYHDGRILDPDVKFYHMKGNTGWCGYLKSSGAGNPLDCTHETPEEFNYRIWGLKKV